MWYELDEIYEEQDTIHKMGVLQVSDTGNLDKEQQQMRTHTSSAAQNSANAGCAMRG